MKKLFFDQPVQCFFAGVEGRNRAPRESLEIFHDRVRDGLGPEPCRFLDERAVEGKHFFDAGDYRAIQFGAAVICQRKERFAAVLRHRDPQVLEEKQHLLGGRLREIDQQDLLAFVLDEVDAVIHRKPGSGLWALGSEFELNDFEGVIFVEDRAAISLCFPVSPVVKN